MRKWLKRIGFLLLGILGFLVLAVLVVWEDPSLLLNEANAKRALRYAPEGTSVQWGTFRLSFSREGFWGKGVNFEVHDLCFREGKELEGCAPVVHADVSFTIKGFHPRLTRLGALVLDVRNLVARTTPSKKPPPKMGGPLPDIRPPAFADFYPALIDPAKIGDVRVDVENLRVESPDEPPLTAAFHLAKNEGARFEAKLSAEKSGSLKAALDGDGEIRGQAFQWTGSLRADASGWKVRFPFELLWSERVELRGTPVARKGADRYTAPLALRWDSKHLSLDTGRVALDKLWPKKRMLVDACHLDSALDGKEGYPKHSTLKCGLALLSLERGSILPPMKAALDADLALAAKGRDTAAAELSVKEQGKNDYLESQLDFRGSARFHPSSNEIEGTPDLSFHSTLKVPELQRWKTALDHTPLALPAPFRTLGGPANFEAKLEHVDAKELKAAITLATDFRGGREAFVTRHKAEVRLANPFRGKKALDLSANLELTDVALEAPPLQLGAPPQFLPDKRFEDTASAKPAAPSMPVTWKASITTKAPVRIRTNLLENEVPVALDLQLASGQTMDGTIQLLEMPLTVFKKKAELQNLKITYTEGSTVGDVNGTVIYRNPEILVKILLLGSTDKPRVEFLSEPPLNRQQIVSVLLFNKSVNELTEDEASSAGSFSEATADGALGLFSLLFLSSTPIESIGYDPVTQTYTARLRLDKKTTLSVGSDFDRERQVALRRRLGGRWAIRTELHNQQGQPDVLLTLLEWFKRF